MRYQTLFYVGFLPTTVLAQTAVPLQSGIAHHSGTPVGVASARNGTNHTHSVYLNGSTANASSRDSEHEQHTATGVPPRHSVNTTGIYAASVKSADHVSATGKPFTPYTRPTGAPFMNRTADHRPTRAAGASLGFGTGVSITSKPTEDGGHLDSYGTQPTPMVSAAGRLSNAKEAHFVNSTSKVQPWTRTRSHASGAGVPSGWAKQTVAASHTRTPSNDTATSRRLPFTKGKGFHFVNSTSSLGQPFETGVFHSSGTGVSSGFVKPTLGADNAQHSYHTSRVLSTNNRLPHTESLGPIASATPTQTSFPTLAALSAGEHSSEDLSADAIAASSGRLPFTTSTGLVFSNHTSTRSPQASGSAASTRPLVTAPLSAAQPPPSSTFIGSDLSIPTTLLTKASQASSFGSTIATASSSPRYPASSAVIPQDSQCGGQGFKGKGSCDKNSVCKKWNPYYHQCVDKKFL